MQRDDIPQSQLKKITDEMRRLANAGMSEAIKAGAENILYGVRILERYPSAEHEDLALLLLNSSDATLRSNAATTLGRIGTAKSVEPMRKHFDPFRHIKTDPPNDGHQVFEAEQMLLARVAASSKQVETQPGIVSPKQSNAPRSTPSPSPSGAAITESTPWAIIIVIIAAALGLLWLVLKRRS